MFSLLIQLNAKTFWVCKMCWNILWAFPCFWSIVNSYCAGRFGFYSSHCRQRVCSLVLFHVKHYFYCHVGIHLIKYPCICFQTSASSNQINLLISFFFSSDTLIGCSKSLKVTTVSCMKWLQVGRIWTIRRVQWLLRRWNLHVEDSVFLASYRSKWLGSFHWIIN